MKSTTDQPDGIAAATLAAQSAQPANIAKERPPDGR
jgi:hypothetical protein